MADIFDQLAKSPQGNSTAPAAEPSDIFSQLSKQQTQQPQQQSKGFWGQAGDFADTITSAAKTLVPGTAEAQHAGETLAYSLRHPQEAWKAHADATNKLSQEARTAWQQGGLAGKSEGLARGIGALVNAVPTFMGMGTQIGQMTDAAKRGDVGQALGLAAVMAGAPKVMHGAGELAGNIADNLSGRSAVSAAPTTAAEKAVGRQFASKDAAEGRTATDYNAAHLATKALKPLNADPNWYNDTDGGDIVSALRRVKSQEQRLGRPVGSLSKSGGLLPGSAPDLSLLNDIDEANGLGQRDLLDRFDTHYLNPAIESQRKSSPIPVLQNVEAALRPQMDRDPAATGAKLAEAARLYGPDGKYADGMSAQQWQEELRNVNAALKAEYNKPNGVTAANVRMHPDTAGKFAEAEALRNGFYDLLGSVQGEDGAIPRDMMREYGKTMTLQEGIAMQKNPSLAYDPMNFIKALPMLGRAAAQYSMGEVRGAASNGSTAMVRTFAPSEGAGALLRDSLKKVTGKPKNWVMPAQAYRTPAGPQGQLGAGVPPPTSGPLPSRTPQLPAGSPGMPPNAQPPIGVQFTPQLPLGQPQLQLPAAQPQLPTGMPGLPPGEIPPAAKGMIVMPHMPQMPKGPTIARPKTTISRAPAPAKPSAGAQAKLRVQTKFQGHKQRLDRQFAGMAKANKVASYGVPPGVLTDQQQGQYNSAVNSLMAQQQQELGAIPDDVQPSQGGVPLPAAGGASLQGPTDVVVGEAGPERIDHSDGRPSDIVNGAQRLTLGTNGADKVVPLTPFPEKGIIRGSSDIPLNDTGRHEAVSLGHHIAAKGGLDEIHSSDLSRTQETAQLIAAANNIQPQPPSPGFRSWSMGDLEGQPVTKETDDIVDHHIHAVPDQPLQGQGPASVTPGESFDQFKNRIIGAIQPLIARYAQNPNLRIGVVTHNRDEKTLKGWVKSGARPNGQIDKRELQEKGSPPGGICKIAFDPNGQLTMEDVDPAKHKMDGGVYTIRHGSTDWNATAPSGSGS